MIVRVPDDGIARDYEEDESTGEAKATNSKKTEENVVIPESALEAEIQASAVGNLAWAIFIVSHRFFASSSSLQGN